MAKALHRFFEIVGEELASTTTEQSPDVNIQFDIEGAGTWSIVTHQGEGTVYCDARPNPDCTISAHVETLLQIAYGRTKPAMAFMRKQIRLSGNKAGFGHANRAYQPASRTPNYRCLQKSVQNWTCPRTPSFQC